jgi:mRNA-degrading endonuclease toxin of MazEF toxin-antitoxin module
MLCQGRIVWAVVSNPAGRNPKRRPGVVVTPTHEIATLEEVVIVAATGTFSRPLPVNRIEFLGNTGVTQ